VPNCASLIWTHDSDTGSVGPSVDDELLPAGTGHRDGRGKEKRYERNRRGQEPPVMLFIGLKRWWRILGAPITHAARCLPRRARVRTVLEPPVPRGSREMVRRDALQIPVGAERPQQARTFLATLAYTP